MSRKIEEADVLTAEDEALLDRIWARRRPRKTKHAQHDQSTHGRGRSAGRRAPTPEEMAEAFGMTLEQAEAFSETARRTVSRLFGQPDTATPTAAERKGVGKLGTRRAGECFNSANEYAIAHRDLPGMKVVHGTVETPGGDLLAHGWVDLGDKVFDGTWTQFFDKQSYTDFTGAKVEREYTAEEAMAKMLQTEHHGPWHDTPGAMRG